MTVLLPPADPPLLVCDDPVLVTEVQRLAAAAGVSPRVVADPPACLGVWTKAPVVLVGAASAAAVAALAPPRRPRVHVLGGRPSGDLFREALALGAESVVELPDAETWLVELLTDIGDGSATPGVTIGVVGGSGGAGATVFAAALAQRAAAVGATLLLDADPLGAGADRVLGLETAEGVRWDSLAPTAGRLSSRSLRESLPRVGQLSVLGWPVERAGPLPATAMREALSAARRGFATVVLDLPRHLDAVAEETVARCDHVVVVAQATVAGAGAAARLVQRLPESGPHRHLVVRGRASGVSAESLAALLGLALLTEMGDQRGLDEAIDLGVGPIRRTRGPLARAAQRGVEVLVAA